MREQLCIHLKTVLHSTFWQEHIDSVPSWKSTSLPGHSMSLSKLRQQKNTHLQTTCSYMRQDNCTCRASKNALYVTFIYVSKMLLLREILISTFPWGHCRIFFLKKVIIYKNRVVHRYSSEFSLQYCIPKCQYSLSTSCEMTKDDPVPDFTLTHKYFCESGGVFPDTY